MQRLLSRGSCKKIDIQQATPVEKNSCHDLDSRDLAFTGPGSSFFLYSMLACFDSGV
jgi:hypothetical protein